MGRVNKDILKGLIKDGFDINLIAFELDVPIEKLREYQMELERVNSKINESLVERRRDVNDILIANQEINRMKKRYLSMYNSDKSKVTTHLPDRLIENEVDKKDIEQTDLIISNINALLKEGNDKSSDEKRKIAKTIYDTECKSLNLQNLTIQQAIRLYELFEHNLLKTFARHSSTDALARSFEKGRKDVVKVLFNLLSEELNQTENVAELESLKDIAFKIDDVDNKIVVSTIRGNITAKIRKLKNQKIFDDLKVVPDEIVKIVEQLVKGNLDIGKAKVVIEQEAQTLVEIKRKNGYPQYKLEDAKKRIEDQIHALLREDAAKYHIECIEELILDLGKLTNKGRDAIIRTIITNLTQRGEYTRAKALCEMCKGTDKKSDNYRTFHGIKQGVERIEVGNAVLKLIKENNTPEEEIELFNKITSATKNGINPETISLGKSIGGKEIRLSSILDSKIEIE